MEYRFYVEMVFLLISLSGHLLIKDQTLMEAVFRIDVGLSFNL
jgi:hypothetical protein